MRKDNYQVKPIIPEHIECTKGAIIHGDYQKTIINIQVSPTAISIHTSYFPRKLNKPEEHLELKSLAEYQAWYKKLQEEYGKRITRTKCHYYKEENGRLEEIENPLKYRWARHKAQQID